MTNKQAKVSIWTTLCGDLYRKISLFQVKMENKVSHKTFQFFLTQVLFFFFFEKKLFQN